MPGAAAVAPTRLTLGVDPLPALLHELDTPPEGLWALGDPSLLAHRARVAIVGTRAVSPYGERTARALGRAVAAAGGCVISGMAFGADAAAHEGALDADGLTVAVLASGVDVPTPASNRRLYRRILERGLVVSEYAPGRPALKYTFRERNRLIAALATVVVVVEAPLKSGALSTAEHALDLGLPTAIVPGPIDSPQSRGSNLLARDGAHLLASEDDLLTLAGLTAPKAAKAPAPADPRERAIHATLAAGALSVDAITARTGLPARECMAALTALEIAGRIEASLAGTFRLR